MGIEQVLTAPRSSWQNAFVECVIGSIQRVYQGHVIILNARHSKRVLRGYLNIFIGGKHICRRGRTVLNRDWYSCQHLR